MVQRYQGLIEQYREFLPVASNVRPITLLEGNTPLIKLNHLPQTVGFRGAWYVKFEGLNPTGSFKDRGMTVAVSNAVANGARAIICASTGNTSASAAAYAARAGIKAVVLIPEGNVAAGKLAQAGIHAAQIIQIQGNFDQGMALVKEIATRLPVSIVNSINPDRLAGQKTAAYEIIDSLGEAPFYHALPVGNAGNISAYWAGYLDYFRIKKSKRKPKMLGYQASGAAPFIQGKSVPHPETVATAIRIGNPQSWDLAVQAQTQSAGWFHAVSDAEILHAQQLLAKTEGIFCEPASAAAIAGVIHDIMHNKLDNSQTLVCTLTGHGLKDPDIVMRHSQWPMTTIQPEIKTLEAVLSATI